MFSQRVELAALLLVVAGCSSAAPAKMRDSVAARAPSRRPDAPQPSCAELKLEPMPEPDTKLDLPLPPIVDPKRTLAGFYRRLATHLRGGSNDHVRIAIYGDSNMTRDEISGEVRRVLQARYGDGGHGWVSIGKPWSWYTHQDVEHGIEPKAWRSFAVSTHAVIDDSYGFSGIAAQSISDGARAWVATAGPGAPVGTHASRLDVYYLMQPHAGGFRVRADGNELAQIDTAAPDLSLGFRRFELEDAPHKFLFSADLGARLLGVALEREKPGIVVDSLGVGGVKIEQLARMRRSIAAEALARRKYDLVIVLTGATEDDTDRHDAALASFIALHRSALPEVACIVMSPPDYANGTAQSPRPSKRITRLGRRKQRVALENGCAFWDFHRAMGGELSIARFAARGLAWADLAHLNQPGSELMARRFLQALWSDLGRESREHPDIGCKIKR